MKVMIIFLLFVSMACPTMGQLSGQKLATYVKVWGFLKYYHPAIAAGKIDWDAEFIAGIGQIESLHSKESLSTYYLDRIEKLGLIKKCSRCPLTTGDCPVRPADFRWLGDTTEFSAQVADKLNFIKDNAQHRKNYYATKKHFAIVFSNAYPTYENEKRYQDSVYPSQAMRILTLARYWNVINYFYPYKYNLVPDWDVVLAQLLPAFSLANDTLSYHRAMLELTSSIKDSHASFSTPYTYKLFGVKWPPFKITILDSSAIVTYVYNDSLCEADDIRYGDVILSVDDVAISQLVERASPYTSASNQGSLRRNLTHQLLKGHTDSVVATFERNGKFFRKTVHRYYFSRIADGFFKERDQAEKRERPWRILEGNLGYIDLGQLKVGEVSIAMNELKTTGGLIIDIRSYPGDVFNICDFLGSSRTCYAKLAAPDFFNPGYFQFVKNLYCGKKNKQPYKGQVVVLINEYTQSKAELMVMAIQAAIPTLTIGSATAGADGDNVSIPLPGGYRTSMSGLGVFILTGVRHNGWVSPRILLLNQQSAESGSGEMKCFLKPVKYSNDRLSRSQQNYINCLRIRLNRSSNS